MGLGGKDHKKHSMSGMSGMSGMAGMPGMAMLNDVAYDAYLTNDRTLADPEIVQVEAGGRVRLRIINAAAASNMLIDLGSLTGEIVALDGNPIEPLKGSTFALAIAQRADIRITLPGGRGAWPILARPEGLTARTGLILASPGARIDAVDETGDPSPAITDFALEARPRPVIGLVDRPADIAQVMDLGGDDMTYRWNINGVTDPHGVLMKIKTGQRVEITLRNQTMMSHPMHLHGHHFQIVGVGSARFSGPMRDTVLVPAGERLTIAFDADNPGQWVFHCHHLYHMNAGMMAAIAYEAA
jgi:FtsP/CotA-like multicopper oxidase with cupredoxin domain